MSTEGPNRDGYMPLGCGKIPWLETKCDGHPCRDNI